MWKTIAVVMSIISSIIAITIYSTTLPDTQKQVEDNAAAIEQNAEEISSVDNSVDGLNTRLETLEEKHLYLFLIELSYRSNNNLVLECYINIYKSTTDNITNEELFNYFYHGARNSITGIYYDTTGDVSYNICSALSYKSYAEFIVFVYNKKGSIHLYSQYEISKSDFISNSTIAQNHILVY